MKKKIQTNEITAAQICDILVLEKAIPGIEFYFLRTF